jgi:hypothetical protein
VLAIAVVALVAAAGCSGSEGAAPATNVVVTTAPTASTAPTSVAPPSVTAASVTTPPTTEDPWCGLAQQLEDTDNILDSEVITDPAAVEAAITGWIAQLVAAQPFAPPAIQAEIQTTIDVVTSLNMAFAAVDYRVLDVDLGAIEGLDTDMPAAAAAIEAYNLAECGIVANDEPAGEPGDVFDPNAGSVRQQAVARFVEQGFTEDEANCLVEQIDLAPAGASSATIAPAEAFASCGITAERLRELGG